MHVRQLGAEIVEPKDWGVIWPEPDFSLFIKPTIVGFPILFFLL